MIPLPQIVFSLLRTSTEMTAFFKLDEQIKERGWLNWPQGIWSMQKFVYYHLQGKIKKCLYGNRAREEIIHKNLRKVYSTEVNNFLGNVEHLKLWQEVVGTFINSCCSDQKVSFFSNPFILCDALPLPFLMAFFLFSVCRQNYK